MDTLETASMIKYIFFYDFKLVKHCTWTLDLMWIINCWIDKTSYKIPRFNLKLLNFALKPKTTHEPNVLGCSIFEVDNLGLCKKKIILKKKKEGKRKKKEKLESLT